MRFRIAFDVYHGVLDWDGELGLLATPVFI